VNSADALSSCVFLAGGEGRRLGEIRHFSTDPAGAGLGDGCFDPNDRHRVGTARRLLTELGIPRRRSR
jgi:hypothetical protein